MFKKIKSAYTKRKIKKAQEKEYVRSMPSAYDNAVISWVSLEHVNHERGKVWKVSVIIIVILSVVLGIYYNAWTFSLAILVFTFVYYLVDRDHPKTVEVSLSDIGIKVGHRKYAYGRIKAFWIIYNPPYVKTLTIRVNGEFLVDIVIQLNDQNPAEIREYLLEKIPEMEGKEESLSDIFLRLFKI